MGHSLVCLTTCHPKMWEIVCSLARYGNSVIKLVFSDRWYIILHHIIWTSNVFSLAANFIIIIRRSEEQDRHQIFHINHLGLVRPEDLIRWEAFTKSDLGCHWPLKPDYQHHDYILRRGFKILIMSNSRFLWFPVVRNHFI